MSAFVGSLGMAASPSRIRDCYLHAAKLGLPLVEGGPADAMRSM
jgi:hypothetical protein